MGDTRKKKEGLVWKTYGRECREGRNREGWVWKTEGRIKEGWWRE